MEIHPHWSEEYKLRLYELWAHCVPIIKLVSAPSPALWFTLPHQPHCTADGPFTRDLDPMFGGSLLRTNRSRAVVRNAFSSETSFWCFRHLSLGLLVISCHYYLMLPQYACLLFCPPVPVWLFFLHYIPSVKITSMISMFPTGLWLI